MLEYKKQVLKYKNAPVPQKRFNSYKYSFILSRIFFHIFRPVAFVYYLKQFGGLV